MRPVVTETRKNYLGPEKTCLRSIRDDLDRGKLVCATKLKHFAKKNIQKKLKIKKVRFGSKIFFNFFENGKSKSKNFH